MIIETNFLGKIELLEENGKLTGINLLEILPKTNKNSTYQNLNNHSLLEKIKIKYNKTKNLSPLLQETIKQLQEYFDGNRKEFDIPIKLKGTDFQIKVWQELQKIPYGQTISYSELAKRINCPKAVRAVGGACGKNPILIIVPCHRVLGKNGNLTGFSGGIDYKEKLLILENTQK